MTEHELERRIIDKLSSLGLEGLNFVGLWSPDGFNRKGDEKIDKGVCVVRVAPAVFETFGLSEATFDCAVVLTLRTDACPGGQELLDYAKSIGDVFKEWNSTTAGDQLVDLLTESFEPGGIYFTASSGPDFDGKSSTWSVSWNFSLRGIITA